MPVASFGISAIKAASASSLKLKIAFFGLGTLDFDFVNRAPSHDDRTNSFVT